MTTDDAIQEKGKQECYLCHATWVPLVIWRDKMQCEDALSCRLRMADEIMGGDE